MKIPEGVQKRCKVGHLVFHPLARGAFDWDAVTRFEGHNRNTAAATGNSGGGP